MSCPCAGWCRVLESLADGHRTCTSQIDWLLAASANHGSSMRWALSPGDSS